MRNFDATIISQFYSSPILTQILTNINGYIDPDANLEAFFNDIWNIETAQGYGLDLWGRIVGIGRVLQVSVGNYFGFNEATGMETFGFGPFYAGQPATENYALSDEAYRLLILAKAASNICDGSIGAINAIMMSLFPGRGNAYVTDGQNEPIQGPYFGFKEGLGSGFGQAPFGDLATITKADNMTMIYVFTFPLQPFEVSMVLSGVLPKPAGVLASYQYTAA